MATSEFASKLPEPLCFFFWHPEKLSGQPLRHPVFNVDISLPRGIPTAIEEQPGLKLARAKVALATVIVDSADKVATEN